MSDATTGRLDEALAAPDESENAGRRSFIAIVWLVAAIGLIAHGLEAGLGSGFDGAAGFDGPVGFFSALAIFAALAVWLHVVHRVQSWSTTQDPATVSRMLAGVLVALVALIAIDSAHLLFLFGAFTLTFGFAPSPRFATVASFIVTLVWVGGWLFHGLPTGALATPFLVWGTLNVITQVMGRVTAQSIERRALLEEIRETRAALAQAEHERGVLTERARVSAEIHDTLAQGFTSIVLLSQAASSRLGDLEPDALDRSLGLIEETARENLVSSRRLVENLGPAELDRSSLVETIEREAARFGERSGGAIATVTVVGTPVPLGGAIDVTILRVLQESLNNAKKYAKATRVTIELEYELDAITLAIADDGVGFDPAAGATEVAGITGGHGLSLMANRLDDVGGEVEITSTVGQGTLVVAAIPIEPEHPSASTEGEPAR